MLSNAARPINIKPKKKTNQEDFLGIVICAPASVSKMAIQHGPWHPQEAAACTENYPILNQTTSGEQPLYHGLGPGRAASAFTSSQ